MAHYFDDNHDNFQLLQARADAWVGTPYRHGGSKIKLGVDCVQFVTLICFEIGVITEVVELGYYPPSWYLKRDNAIVESIDYYMENHLNPAMTHQVSEADKNGRAGDLLCFQIKSPVVNHVGVKLLGNRIIHANTRAKKVVVESIEGYRKYLRKVYSFWEAE